MNNKITYLFRKSLPKFHSIEALFYSIDKEVSKSTHTDRIFLEYSGGMPLVIFKNLCGFKKIADRSLYHITGDIHYMGLVTGKQTILTVHDVQSIVKGSYIKKIYLKLMWFWLPALFVKKITVISEFTRKELERIVPFAKHKITTVYNPVNPTFKFSSYQFNQYNPRILLLGTKPNKNLERVLTALQGINCEIVLIGHLTHEQKDLINTLELNLTTKFDLSLSEIVDMYTICDLLCFVSTYEGFGMPIIEAQAIGRPVVTSNIGAMKEVAGDAACFVDPYDVEAIKCGIKEVIENADFRNKLIQRGMTNVKRFNPEVIAQDYLNIYKELED